MYLQLPLNGRPLWVSCRLVGRIKVEMWMRFERDRRTKMRRTSDDDIWRRYALRNEINGSTLFTSWAIGGTGSSTTIDSQSMPIDSPTAGGCLATRSLADRHTNGQPEISLMGQNHHYCGEPNQPLRKRSLPPPSCSALA